MDSNRATLQRVDVPRNTGMRPGDNVTGRASTIWDTANPQEVRIQRPNKISSGKTVFANDFETALRSIVGHRSFLEAHLDYRLMGNFREKVARKVAGFETDLRTACLAGICSEDRANALRELPNRVRDIKQKVQIIEEAQKFYRLPEVP